MNVYNERLQDLGQRASALLDSIGDDVTLDDAIYATALAAFFDYQVKNGGFAQLIYNAGSPDVLEHCHVMLEKVGAPVALSYYIRAVTLCAENRSDYQQLLADPTALTQLNQDLTLLSVEYLRGEVTFDDEIDQFLDIAEASL